MEILIFLGGFIFGALCIFIPMKIISANNINSKQDRDIMLEKMQEQMKLYFENTANKVFDDSSAKLTEQNKEKLEEFFKRFKDKIEDFEKLSVDNFRIESENFTKFDTNIKSFLETGNRLVNVMKSDNRSSGRWGEIVLERVLEFSGLREGKEYIAQKGTNDGRPDVTVLMPDEKIVYIDSKTSFQAWDGYANAQNDDERKEYLKQFKESTKKHISGLSEKYKSDNSPDYILMFIPIESCYSLLYCDDCEIWEYAWKNKVMPVSPSTLLAALKIIEAFYKVDRQNKNVLEMTRLCTSVHDKFVSLLDDMIRIRNSINDTLKKLDGKGNIISQITKLETLGEKYEKSVQKLAEKEFDSADID